MIRSLRPLLRKPLICLHFEPSWQQHRLSCKMAASSEAGRVTLSTVDPPIHVRGMKVLDRRLFDKQVRVPCVRVANVEADMGPVLQSVKKFLLKMDNLKPVCAIGGGEEKAEVTGKMVILNPDLVSSIDDLDEKSRRALEDAGVLTIEFRDLRLSYNNFKSEQILNAVLPEDAERTTAYSRVGHIVHVNLREHLFEYRHLIGQVLLDKLSGVTCVVNKTDAIETTFRNFKMEVLAGGGDQADDSMMVANVRENGCQYEFDFGRVFWNPRLSSEHERLASLLPDVGHVVLYDVFAGVGPFAVPAARRRKCRVLANDLNPDSFRWLQHNVKLNKVSDRVTCYNLDGRAFIRDVVAKDMFDCWTGTSGHVVVDDEGFYVVPQMHVAMNLPALAIQFLDAFRGLFKGQAVHEKAVPPMIHCYAFAKLEAADRDHGQVLNSVEEALGHALDRSGTRVTFVRKVAPNKDMIRATFQLPLRVLYDEDRVREPDSKRSRLDIKESI